MTTGKGPEEQVCKLNQRTSEETTVSPSIVILTDVLNFLDHVLLFCPQQRVFTTSYSSVVVVSQVRYARVQRAGILTLDQMMSHGKREFLHMDQRLTYLTLDTSN